MAREIPLTKGFVAIVDQTDYDDLMQFKWSVILGGGNHTRPYARRSIRLPGDIFTSEKMHRRLIPEAEQVDHINGNSLDNRRANLRSANHAENQRNQAGPRVNNTSGYRGVSWHRAVQKWQAQITFDGQHNHLGCFATAQEAARVFDAAAVDLFGEFHGYLNFPDQVGAT